MSTTSQSSAVEPLLSLRVFGDGAAASCIAEAASLPLEVAKMRLQLQRADIEPGKKPRYTGMLSAFRTIVRQEGLHSLWKVRARTQQRAPQCACLHVHTGCT